MNGIDRRTLLAGASLGMAALMAGPAFAARPRLETIALFDTRYADARRFAAAARALGASALPIVHDMVWQWRALGSAQPARLIGLTTGSDQMILAALAMEHGGRIMFEADHDGRGGSVIAHRTRQGPSFATSDDAWAERLASHLLIGRGTSGASHCAPRAADFPGSLRSCLIEFPR